MHPSSMVADRAHRHNAESGFAVLLSVLLVAILIAGIAALVFGITVDNVNVSGHNVQHQQALQAAQGGVDLAYEQIQAAPSTKTAPCGSNAVSGKLGSTPSMSSYAVSITYYLTSTAKTPLSCPTMKSGVIPKSVKVTSVGDDAAQHAKAVSLADISVNSTPGSVFGDGVFVNSNFKLTGADDFQFPGHSLYVNGSIDCTNGGDSVATLLVSGSVEMSGACAITGNVTSGGTVSVPSGSPSVSGFTASASTTNPDITITGNPTLHTLKARTTITKPAYWSPDGNTLEDDSAIAAPNQTFPTVVWTAAGWGARGYNVVTAGSTCTKVYDTIWSMRTATSPAAIDTSCKVALPGSGSTDCPTWQDYYCTHVELAKSLAIISTTGFDLATPAHFTASAAGVDLMFIVPSSTTCSSSVGNITFTGKTTAGSTGTTTMTPDALFYTPCKVSMTGAASVAQGEVYAGTFDAKDGMKFGAAITVPGTSGGTAPTLGGPATVGIISESDT